MSNASQSRNSKIRRIIGSAIAWTPPSITLGQATTYFYAGELNESRATE